MPDLPRDVTIVIADDHPLFRDGLRKLLESEPGFCVVGEAADGADAVRLVREQAPDVLLLDLSMPRTGGLEALRAMADGPTRVIILTAAIRQTEVLHALQLGARGVVLKEAATRQLIDDIRHVVAGKLIVGEETVEDLVQALRHPSAVSRGRQYGLTPRERDIVSAVAAGRSNREIADQFAISVQTVKHHLTSIFDKTGVSSRLELAIFASRHRLAADD